MENVKFYLSFLGRSVLPRILTQICRDPGSPFYGSCDRNWWHYKIRDFSSIILQQAGYAILKGASFSDSIEKSTTLAAQTCRFWNQRAVRYGAFEEYYPYEKGYPPVAFSTLSVAKLCREGVINLDEISPGLSIATKQLLSRFEPQAANQQVAGTAALASINSLDKGLVSDFELGAIVEHTLNLQNEEGWFPEYGGPDLGYLSVTLDCLWDIYDITEDQLCLSAIHRSFEYLSWFVLGPIKRAGMLNSRNTDYIVPYGIARLAVSDGQCKAKAEMVLKVLYSPGDEDGHFFQSIDDRYWCHYIGHSLFRAINVLSGYKKHAVPVSSKKPSNLLLRDAMQLSGHYLVGTDCRQFPKVLVAAKKGGVFTAAWPSGETVSDFGWVIKTQKKIYISHWWSDNWKVETGQNKITCQGDFFTHREHISTPLKHAVLRVVSLLVGSRLISILKKMIIFKNKGSSLLFKRSIYLEKDKIVVEDVINGIYSLNNILRAPRSSKRHVASADCYHKEDFVLNEGVKRDQNFKVTDEGVCIVTKYEKKEKSCF